MRNTDTEPDAERNTDAVTDAVGESYAGWHDRAVLRPDIRG
jgi:hypothetical protein